MPLLPRRLVVGGGVVFREGLTVRLMNLALALSLLSLTLLPFRAEAWIRSPATTFATLPAEAANPEGITVDSAGNVYVTTFAVNGTTSGTGQLFVFEPSGRLLRHQSRPRPQAVRPRPAGGRPVGRAGNRPYGGEDPGAHPAGSGLAVPALKQEVSASGSRA